MAVRGITEWLVLVSWECCILLQGLGPLTPPSCMFHFVTVVGMLDWSSVCFGKWERGLIPMQKVG
jgi:hypothetical protein